MEAPDGIHGIENAQTLNLDLVLPQIAMMPG